MNFIAIFFFIFCTIFGLNAVEIELEAPSDLPETTQPVPITDPFDQQRTKNIALITIEDQTSTRYHWVMATISLKSKTDPTHQTSFLVVNCSPTSADEAVKFILDICKALEEINQVSVGQQLLKDICQANKGKKNLVIFNTELFEKLLNVQEIQSIGPTQKEIESLKQKTPKIINEFFSLFVKQNEGQLLWTLNQIIEDVAAFSPSGENDNGLNAMVCVRNAGFERILWDFKDFNIRMETSEIPLHLHLFHELNHYRHYSSQKGGYNGTATLHTKNQTSTLGIKIEGKDCYMQDAEEELQQTGYTRVKLDSSQPDQELFDPVNEIVYRRQKQLPIRFPYQTRNLKSLFGNQNRTPLSINNALTILLHALDKTEYNNLCRVARDKIHKAIGDLIESIAKQQ